MDLVVAPASDMDTVTVHLEIIVIIDGKYKVRNVHPAAYGFELVRFTKEGARMREGVTMTVDSPNGETIIATHENSQVFVREINAPDEAE